MSKKESFNIIMMLWQLLFASFFAHMQICDLAFSLNSDIAIMFNDANFP